jgi:hypothetical protein
MGRPPVKLSKEEVAHIIALYESGKSVHAIGREVEKSGDFIHKRLLKWGVEMRSPAHKRCKYNVDHDAFHRETEAALYFAGLIAADGMVTDRNTVSLTSKDRDVLHKFAKFSGDLSRAQYDNGDGTYTVLVSSKRMADYLRSVGITARKSLTCNPAPRLVRSRHFWRGMIDGDGSVYFPRKAVYLGTGSPYIADHWMDFLDERGIDYRLYYPKGGFTTIYTGSDDAVRICEILYMDSNAFMERKANKAFAQIKGGAV